jgi:ataxin-3
MSDLLKGKSTEEDPWEKMQGQGMRLDGTSGSGSGTVTRDTPMDIEGLTEEEQIALAMQQSLEPSPPSSQPAVRNVTQDFSIPDEPAKGEKGSCRIQLRMPDGSRLVRLFHTTDLVGGIYALVSSKCGNKAISLKAGYPPKDLLDSVDKSIADAGLAGESIQARYS